MEAAVDGSRVIGERAGVATGTAPAPARADDDALVLAARAGDDEAFTVLYRRYVRLVHGIVLARVPRTDVEDLVQEVFVTAWRRLPGLREPGAFAGWLATMARNRATDFLRSARPTTELPETLSAPPRPQAEAMAVLDAIRSLPEAYRETLTWRLVEGLTGPEIAERTGLKPESVRVNLHRGMKMLRARLGGPDGH